MKLLRVAILVTALVGVWFISDPATDGLADWATANAITHGISPQAPMPEIAQAVGIEAPIGAASPRTPGAILLLMPYVQVPAARPT